MKIIRTCDAKKAYWAEENLAPKTGQEFMNAICVYPDVQYQTIKGFGGAVTESAAYCYDNLSDESKTEFVESYYGESGLRYTLARTHLNSCDFALENYACLENEGADYDFSRNYKYIKPMFGAIEEYRGKQLDVMLSAWSPPAFMKTNNEMNNGGELKPQYYAQWADCIAQYIKECGLKIDMVSVQNEPQAVQTWDSCIYSAEQEAKFATEYLAKSLEKIGRSDIKILIWDHNKEAVVKRVSDTMKASKSPDKIGGVAFHWYTGDHFEALGIVKQKFPQLDIYFTEGCVEYSRFSDSDNVQKAQMYAHDMIGNFNNYTNGFYDWNLILDANGGPNHVGNFCEAPLMCDNKGGFEKKLSYYYIGHFSKYVMPGAVRIGVSRFTSDIECCAFLNPDGQKVLVALNCTDQGKDVNVTDGAGNNSASFTIDAHSIVTLLF